ncbi:apolipoprotein N-acyltransferase [Nocardioides gansuensis]|uniref:Apolipoprotein N-acyltransferase n=2 Tax=Nocardioides gansuensis TaxID=2138300 RepID=A0A2T8FEC4_9ACTN|nr:apolipoprotein N-acyltransferase [Nocardioides gansuensis]
MPVAIALLLLSVRRERSSRAWLTGLCFGITFICTLLWWLRAVGTDAWLALSALEAAFFAPLGLGLALVSRLPGWPLWSSLLWVAVETWRGAWPFSGLPWGRLSYAVAGTPWEHGLPWIGMTGVSLLVAGTGAALAWLVVTRAARRAAAVLMTAGLAAGSLLPTVAAYPLEGEGSVTVAAVQGGVPGNDLVAVHREVTANHVTATADLAADVEAGRLPAPDFVVWPENSTAVDPFTDPSANAGIESAVDAIGVPVLVGAMVDHDRDPGQVLNQGIVWSPDTGGGDRYTKRHPVPYGEYIPLRDTGLLPTTYGQLSLIPRDMASGTRLEPLRIDGALVADAICFDVAYDDGIHAQVARGGQLLTVQTSNAMFIETAQVDQQFEISRLRAVETGRWVVVAATSGISGVIAPDGTVVAQSGRVVTEVLVEEVGLSSTITPAVRMGAWPGRVAVAGAVVSVLFAVGTYRGTNARRAPVPPEDREVART